MLVEGKQSQEPSECGQDPSYLGLNSGLQKVGVSGIPQGLGALYGKELYRCLSVDSYIFEGLKSQRNSYRMCLRGEWGAAG